MPKMIDYVCNGENCKEVIEEMFNDTEVPPKELEEKCKCGGTFTKGLNWKNNCQVWSWNDRGGLG